MNMEAWHTLNIYLHVLSGSIALLLGSIALLSKKGGKLHRRAGRLFLKVISVVIVTGLLGVFIFGRNTFLLVITVLSGYVAYSGFRVLKLKNNQVNITDILVGILTLMVLVYFLYYFREIGMIWSPVIIYSTVGALLVVIIYDFCKYLIPQSTYSEKRIWLYEHIYKMTSAFAALLSAFTGTVLDQYQPYSQFLPSVLGILIIIGFMIWVTFRPAGAVRRK
ncbi:DUF2306 domain-containing protein [Fulvivirga sedimenti]|uniref:DUF2306 domain-containing protein n=1 Tax=Fulvivirga sedimenti TaxID=2879465 RepID=A0A9X1HPE4_9BACT|nr:DUF2306 domain-containing protein [Fulvivirga sedimenti]MCA6073762.1 DUF2306 domain-containing protein [Fulvivirga sedimenti]